MANNSQLPNPYDLLGWKKEVALLPDISWPDIYNYFITFANVALKVYKSLDAYNYFVTSRTYIIMKFKKIVSSASSNQRQVLYVVEADTSALVF